MLEIYSHPEKPLRDHAVNVMKLGLAELHNKNLNTDCFKKIMGEDFDLELLTRVVLLVHDFGKATDYFQNKLLNGIDDQRANHGQLSGVFAHYVLEQIFGDTLISMIGYCIVARHHGNLKDFRDLLQLDENELIVLEDQFSHSNLSVLQSILDEGGIRVSIVDISFEELLGGLVPGVMRRNWRKLKNSRLENLENYLLVTLIYSLLISADKADAIFYSNRLSFADLQKLVLSRSSLPEDIIDRYKEFKGWDKATDSMNLKRNQIYQEIVDNIKNLDLSKKILSINVPTGTGKTLGALSGALHLKKRLLVESGTDYRIIYTLPFTSIIDQNYSVFQEVLETVGLEPDNRLLLKHHYLTPRSYKWNEEYDDQYPDVSEHLVETWNSEIIVTTFVQLLHTIFSNQNRSLKKFHQLANSIILLDEVQSIPHHYWILIKQTLMLMSQVFNCYFILITATMPLIFSEQNSEITELALSKKDYFAFFDRIKLNLSYFKDSLTLDQFKDILDDDLNRYTNQSFLIVLNTIGTSIEIYQYLKEKVEEENLVYLSTNIIPKHRLERIEKIKKAQTPLVIVSTQMIEAGVDIDIDRVYRDFGPLDAINQTCGRCNRNFNPSYKGEVILIDLVNANHGNKEYGSYVYGDFLLSKTRDVLKELPEHIEERHFYEMNLQYFEKVNQGKNEEPSEVLLSRMGRLEYKLAFEDDSEVYDGKSQVFRLIENDQKTVNLFIEVDEKARNIWQQYKNLAMIEDPFERKKAFEKIKGKFLSYVITIPENVAKKQLESTQIEQLFNQIPEEQVKSVYDLETGFVRKIDESDFFF